MKLLLVTPHPQTIRQFHRILDPVYSHISTYELQSAMTLSEAMVVLQTFESKITLVDMTLPEAMLSVPLFQRGGKSRVVAFADSQKTSVPDAMARVAEGAAQPMISALEAAAKAGADSFISLHIAVNDPAALYLRLAFQLAKLKYTNGS